MAFSFRDSRCRSALQELCRLLGVSYVDYQFGPISIGEYSLVHGAESGRRPVSREEFEALLDYLNIERVRQPMVSRYQFRAREKESA